MVYPALLPLMRTPWLPVVDWTDAPANLNGLIHFVERRNLVSACVPSHFKRSLPFTMQHMCVCECQKMPRMIRKLLCNNYRTVFYCSMFTMLKYTRIIQVQITCGQCQHSANTVLSTCKKRYVYVAILTQNRGRKYLTSQNRQHQWCRQTEVR
jgi:hypothetical protein